MINRSGGPAPAVASGEGVSPPAAPDLAKLTGQARRQAAGETLMKFADLWMQENGNPDFNAAMNAVIAQHAQLARVWAGQE